MKRKYGAVAMATAALVVLAGCSTNAPAADDEGGKGGGEGLGELGGHGVSP